MAFVTDLVRAACGSLSSQGQTHVINGAFKVIFFRLLDGAIFQLGCRQGGLSRHRKPATKPQGQNNSLTVNIPTASFARGWILTALAPSLLLEATLGGRLMAGIAGRLLDKEKPAPRPASIRKVESLAQGRARMLAVGR